MIDIGDAVQRRAFIVGTVFCLAACDGSSPAGNSNDVVSRENRSSTFENSATPSPKNLVNVSDTLPIYVNADGIGILRYTRPDGSSRQLWLAAGGFTKNSKRRFEPIASDVGPFSGPTIAIYLPGGKMHLPLDQIIYKLYERDPYEHIAYLKPTVDAAKAEKLVDCGELSRLYECSRTSR